MIAELEPSGVMGDVENVPVTLQGLMGNVFSVPLTHCLMMMEVFAIVQTGSSGCGIMRWKENVFLALKANLRLEQ